jgi:ABC-type methionine transport system ATPase subunit
VHLRASDDADPWDLALVDNVDRVHGDVARAFALLSAIRRAHHHGAALVLATREAGAVHHIADRLYTLEHGRLRLGTAIRPQAATARVAERRSVDRDSGHT